MPVVTNSITIEMPLTEVWDFLDDPANSTQWFAGVTDIVGVNRTEERIGDNWTTKYSVMGFNMDITQTVTEYEKDAKFTISLGGMMPGSYTTTLSGDGGSTKVTQTFDYEVKGGALGKAMDRLVLERMNAKNAKSSLKKLKNLLETKSTA